MEIMVQKEKACVKYKRCGEVSEVFPKLPVRKKVRKYGIILMVPIVIIAVALLCFALIELGERFDGFYNVALKLGLGGFLSEGSPNGGELRDPPNNSLNVESQTHHNESEREETAESERDTEVTDGLEQEIIVDEMSRVELGETYFINYTSQNVDIEGLVAHGFGGAEYNYTCEPAVMILHSYTSSGYSDMDKNDPSALLTSGVVAMGASLAEELTSKGIPAVHITVIHDGDKDPYSAASETVKTMLDIYPSVKLVIDLGRMDIRDEQGRPIKLVSSDGAAQIRFTVSTENSEWRQSMALALELRSRLNIKGRRSCLPVTLSDSRYSVGKSKYYLKIDVGTAANSSNEASLATDFLAEAILDVLKK